MLVRKNITTRPIQSQIIFTTCTITLFTQLMFFVPLRSITPGISMRR